MTPGERITRETIIVPASIEHFRRVAAACAEADGPGWMAADAITRLLAVLASARAVGEALEALRTFPGVRELLAPSGSLGSIADQAEAALAQLWERLER